ncbi:MAG: hypothetical protein HY757_04730 [Nitrospirae bacterium]|nr:hypothetical protein [Nitrospirota bacterium]
MDKGRSQDAYDSRSGFIRCGSFFVQGVLAAYLFCFYLPSAGLLMREEGN